jgi:hypothetical protein
MKDYEFMPHLKESKFLSTGCLDLFVIQLSQGTKHVNDDDDDSIQYFDSAKKVLTFVKSNFKETFSIF